MIGVDIGGTNLLVGRIEHGKVIERLHQPIAERSNFEAVAEQACEIIRDLEADLEHGVGIAVAGSVDATRGVVLRAQNLDWDDAPLAQHVSSELKCKVVIENDVTAAAWGEFKFGAGRHSDSIFAAWIGTGIGGGLILDRNIWRGPLGTGGEFGMSISEHDPQETHRVLEAFSSRSGLQRVTGNLELDTDAIVEGFNNSESIKDAICSGARRIGTSLANVITLLSLDTVILGGGLVESLGTPFIDEIRTQFDQDVYPPFCKTCVFIKTELGPNAGLLGASDLVNHGTVRANS